MIARLALGAVGVAVGAYGAFLLVSRTSTDSLVATGVWLAAGVLLHDVVLSLAVVAVGGAVTRLLPVPVRLPAVVALVVVGSLTLVAVPVLGRFGAKADNPTLLDRPYLGTWLVLLVLTVVGVAVAGALRARRDRRARPSSADPT